MHSPKVRAALIVVGSIALSLIVAEMALRTLLHDRATSGRWGWNDFPNRTSVVPAAEANEMGMRGQSIAYGPGDIVVLLVGDSQVEAPASDANQMPERLLERIMADRLGRPVKVFSLASSGWGQDQQFLALRSYFARFRADVVLIFATPGNDFWENAFPIYSTTAPTGRLKPTFRMRGDILEGPYFEDRFVYGSAILEVVARALSRVDGIPLETKIFERWLATLPPADRSPDAGELARCAKTEAVEHGRLGYDVFSMNDRYTILTDEDFLGSRSHFSPYLVNQSARDRYLIELSRRLYREIETITRGNGAIFRVFYPTRADFDLRFAEHAVCVARRDGLRVAIRFDYRRALEMAVDPANLIVFSLAGEDDIVVSRGDRHLNSIGNARAMGGLAEALVRLVGSGRGEASSRGASGSAHP